MTTRELYNAVIAHINGEALPYGLTEDELCEGFEGLIAKLDAKNAKAKERPRKENAEVAERRAKVEQFFKENGDEFTADEVAEQTGLTAPQVASAVRSMGDAITKGKRKIDSKHSKVTYKRAE